MGIEKTKQERLEKILAEVVDAEKVGIPYQANQALERVTTEIFASFEHDIVLDSKWFEAVLKHMQSDPKIAVAQGVRVTTNQVFKKIEEAHRENHTMREH
jgi:hypothetical protein